MKDESVVSRIISAIFGNKIAVRENLFYDTVKGTGDFEDDDIPNWRATKALLNGIGITGVAAVGDANPVVVPVAVGTCPLVSMVAQLTTDGTNTISTNEQVTLIYRLVYTDNTKTVLQSVLLYGEDDGTNHLLTAFTYSVLAV